MKQVLLAFFMCATFIIQKERIFNKNTFFFLTFIIRIKLMDVAVHYFKRYIISH